MAKGIVKRMETAGRVDIPVEFRRSLKLKEREGFDLYMNGRTIHLKIGRGRKLDELGRYTIPKEVRTSLGFADRQKVDIWIENEEICIRKDGEFCVVCECTNDLHSVIIPEKEVNVCKRCAIAVTDMVMLQRL